MLSPSLLFIGIKGRILAVDSATGREIWRTELKGSGFVNVVVENGGLYAATKGELYGLDPATGQIRWSNSLPGLGCDLISIASSAQSGIAIQREALKRNEDANVASIVAATS